MVRASGGGVTPVPIPNTAVKAPCGDDTAFKSAGKQRGANLFLQKPLRRQCRGGFLFCAGAGEGVYEPCPGILGDNIRRTHFG